MKKTFILLTIGLVVLSCNSYDEGFDNLSPPLGFNSCNSLSAFFVSIDSLNQSLSVSIKKKQDNNGSGGNNNGNGGGNNNNKDKKSDFDSLNASAVIGMDAMGLMAGGLAGSFLGAPGAAIGGLVGAVVASYKADEALKESQSDQKDKPKGKILSKHPSSPPVISTFAKGCVADDKSVGVSTSRLSRCRALALPLPRISNPS